MKHNTKELKATVQAPQATKSREKSSAPNAQPLRVKTGVKAGPHVFEG